MYVVILANTVQEAARYVEAKGLPRGSHRYAARASTIRGLRVAEAHILPGFHKRLDRHAILDTLRWAKHLERVDVSQEEYDQLVDGYPVEKAAEIAYRYEAIKAAGSLYPLEKAAEIAYRYEAIREASRGEEAGETIEGEDAAPAEEESPRRRRSRCKTCNQLHFADEPCVQTVQPVVIDTAGMWA